MPRLPYPEGIPPCGPGPLDEAGMPGLMTVGGIPGLMMIVRVGACKLSWSSCTMRRRQELCVAAVPMRSARGLLLHGSCEAGEDEVEPSLEN